MRCVCYNIQVTGTGRHLLKSSIDVERLMALEFQSISCGTF